MPLASVGTTVSPESVDDVEGRALLRRTSGTVDGQADGLVGVDTPDDAARSARQRILVVDVVVRRQLVGRPRPGCADGEHETGDQRADRDQTEWLANAHPGSPRRPVRSGLCVSSFSFRGRAGAAETESCLGSVSFPLSLKDLRVERRWFTSTLRSGEGTGRGQAGVDWCKPWLGETTSWGRASSGSP